MEKYVTMYYGMVTLRKFIVQRQTIKAYLKALLTVRAAAERKLLGFTP